jgi:hypothetical protein
MKLQGDDILVHIKEQFLAKPNDFPRNGTLDYPAIVTGWIAHLEAMSVVKTNGPIELFRIGGSGSSWFDVMPLFVGVASDGSGLSAS